ncbi:MAG: hypothetical protein LBL81_01490 [Tannerella sp.]|nr:hypothetical protein [Tannerella sp.]
MSVVLMQPFKQTVWGGLTITLQHVMVRPFTGQAGPFQPSEAVGFPNLVALIIADFPIIADPNHLFPSLVRADTSVFAVFEPEQQDEPVVEILFKRKDGFLFRLHLLQGDAFEPDLVLPHDLLDEGFQVNAFRTRGHLDIGFVEKGLQFFRFDIFHAMNFVPDEHDARLFGKYGDRLCLQGNLAAGMGKDDKITEAFFVFHEIEQAFRMRGSQMQSRIFMQEGARHLFPKENRRVGLADKFQHFTIVAFYVGTDVSVHRFPAQFLFEFGEVFLFRISVHQGLVGHIIGQRNQVELFSRQAAFGLFFRQGRGTEDVQVARFGRFCHTRVKLPAEERMQGKDQYQFVFLHFACKNKKARRPPQANSYIPLFI